MAVVETILEEYERILVNTTDPRVQDWLFIGNPLPLVAYVFAYLHFVLASGPRFMQGRKPYNLNTTIRMYNILQVLCCTYLFYSILTNGWLSRRLSLGCQPVEQTYDPQPMKLATLMWWTLVLKMVEFAETVFFILRKKYKQVSFLHVYHHVSTLMFCWIGARYVPGGMATFPVMINCFVHIVMYVYYLLANMGPQVQKKVSKIKPYITLIQMTQFTILVIHAIPAFSSSCNVPKVLPYFYLPNVFLVFYLFYDFYKRAYAPKKAYSSKTSKLK